MYGVIDFRVAKTTPGDKGAFAPPLGFHGEYRTWFRNTFKNDPGVRQHLIITAELVQKGIKVSFEGEFREEAEKAVLSFLAKR